MAPEGGISASLDLDAEKFTHDQRVASAGSSSTISTERDAPDYTPFSVTQSLSRRRNRRHFLNRRLPSSAARTSCSILLRTTALSAVGTTRTAGIACTLDINIAI